MAGSKQQLREDRAIRDAARALVKADMAHLKQDLSGKSLKDRMFGPVSDGAKDVLERAGEAADNNRGVLAALVGAVVLWFARNPIMELFSDEYEDDKSDLESLSEQ